MSELSNYSVICCFGANLNGYDQFSLILLLRNTSEMIGIRIRCRCLDFTLPHAYSTAHSPPKDCQSCHSDVSKT